MIPLGDENPTRSKPVVTIALLIICCLIYLWQLSLGQEGQRAIYALGVIPSRILEFRALPVSLQWVSPEMTVITSMFLHGGFFHLAGNMLYLWIFGDNIEDILGKVAFVLFYLVSGTVAVFTQAIPEPDSTIPMIGASGAISGILGAYVVFFPKHKVRVAIPFGFFIQILRLPAFVVLLFWFIFQLISSSGAGTGGGVAFRAHIGGFIAGLVLGPVVAVLTRRLRKTTESN